VPSAHRVSLLLIALASIGLYVGAGACAAVLGGSPPPGPATALGPVQAAADLDGRPVGADPAVRATVIIVFASWCGHCQDELEILGALVRERPALRVIGVNYREHEEYDDRGSAWAVRAFVVDHAPWLQVVPAGEELFTALGRPPTVPTLYLYDARGELVEVYDRRERPEPSREELVAVLDRLGA